MICPVCRRESRGLGYRDPQADPFKGEAPYFEACSTAHLEVIIHFWKTGEVMKPTNYEKEALSVASDRAGEYLESLQKTDLASLTPDEWMQFLTVVYDTTSAELGRLVAANAVPF